MSKKIINTDEHSDIVRTLKSDRVPSYYAGFVMSWNHETLNSEWLQTYLSIFCKKIEIPQSFIDKYGIKPYHIKLIRRLHFDSNLDNCIANLEYKRPYGNSAVMVDVFDEYNYIEKLFVGDDGVVCNLSNDITESKWIKDNHDFLQNIHNETMNFLDIMLNLLCLLFGLFIFL